jgi:hypothetical protein
MALLEQINTDFFQVSLNLSRELLNILIFGGVSNKNQPLRHGGPEKHLEKKDFLR